MCRQLGLHIRLTCNGCYDYRRTVTVANIILDNQNWAKPRLLRTEHGIKICIVEFSPQISPHGFQSPFKKEICKKQLHGKDEMFSYTTFSMQLLSDFTFTHSICHAPRMMGTLPAAAGAAVITPQRRFTRAPQGSPQVFRRP